MTGCEGRGETEAGGMGGPDLEETPHKRCGSPCWSCLFHVDDVECKELIPTRGIIKGCLASFNIAFIVSSLRPWMM